MLFQSAETIIRLDTNMNALTQLHADIETRVDAIRDDH